MSTFRTIGYPPLVRSEVLLGCREAAAEIKADLAPLLANHGIDPQLLASPSGYIEKPRLVDFLETVADTYHCQHLGFLVGKHQPPLKFGPSAQLLKLAPSLRAALENAIRFSELYTQGVGYELNVDGKDASFRRFNTYHYDVKPVQLDFLGMVQAFTMLRGLCGNKWRPILIKFDQSSPPEQKELIEFFGCPVLFDERYAEIVFPTRDLATELPGANEELLQIVEGYFSSEMSGKQLDQDIVTRATCYIRGQLGTGLCNLDNCAHQLHIHPRTLQREIAKKGFTFKQLILSARMELSRDHLRNSDMRLSVLSELLGYENQSAFSRAFKLEHGICPRQWREANRR